MRSRSISPIAGVPSKLSNLALRKAVTDGDVRQRRQARIGGADGLLLRKRVRRR